MNYFQVAVNFPKQQSVLTYKSQESFEIGELVEVPLGRRKAMGTIISLSNQTDLDKIDEEKLKEISTGIENSFLISSKELDLYKWMSKYYHYSLGKLIFDCLPKILKRPRKIEFIKGENLPLGFDLSNKQSEIFESINSKVNEGFSQHYIHGVTGSGKSAIYLSLMKEQIEAGKSVQFLLPEINLTPQFTDLFSKHLNCEVLTYHSGVTPSEKYNIWKSLNETDKPVLIMGVRSSIFLPINDLGLIIVDEEHDQSFKQTDRCTYNGRDVAIKKAQIHKTPIVLGSATPSLENFYQFEKTLNNRFYYQLPNRVGGAKFPKVIISDVKEMFTENDPAWPLLPDTIDKIREKLDVGEQVLIFINKLGYSNYIQCRNCAHQFYNENCGCENNLRFFKKKNILSCAHCDFKMPLPSECPECGGISLMNKGFGTEKVESVLKMIFKEKNIERFDRDEIKTTKDLSDKLDRFHKGEIDIFVGTQMLAKGHNFKKVNLVVVLGIDSMLNYADFRSSEKTYQLIEQVAGRSGRYTDESEVLIQTMNPEHSVFKLIGSEHLEEFYRQEIPLREICMCPPFAKIAMIYFSSRFRERLVSQINNAFKTLSELSEGHFQSVKLYGPSPMGVEKKANQYTWGIMLKGQDPNDLHGLIQTFEDNYIVASGLSVKLDIDPMHIL